MDTLTAVAKLLTIDVNGNNSTEAGFDRTQIVQVGYSAQWQAISSVGTFYGASKIYEGEPGSYVAKIPEVWKTAWKWYYEGMWALNPIWLVAPGWRSRIRRWQRIQHR